MSPAQVQREATRVDPRLIVSSTLMLSSSELQNQFYGWMDQIPAVRLHPRLVCAMEIVLLLKFAVKEECGALHVLFQVPVLVLMGLRVTVEMCGWSKQSQSTASILFVAYAMALSLLLLALNDPCYRCLGPALTSPATAAAWAAAVLINCIMMNPSAMPHLPLVCWITGIGTIATVYTAYLRDNGGLTMTSDPSLLGLLAITVGTLAALGIAVFVRLRLAMHLMVGFLQSVRP